MSASSWAANFEGVLHADRTVLCGSKPSHVVDKRLRCVSKGSFLDAYHLHALPRLPLGESVEGVESSQDALRHGIDIMENLSKVFWGTGCMS